MVKKIILTLVIILFSITTVFCSEKIKIALSPEHNEDCELVTLIIKNLDSNKFAFNYSYFNEPIKSINNNLLDAVNKINVELLIIIGANRIEVIKKNHGKLIDKKIESFSQKNKVIEILQKIHIAFEKNNLLNKQNKFFPKTYKQPKLYGKEYLKLSSPQVKDIFQNYIEICQEKNSDNPAETSEQFDKNSYIVDFVYQELNKITKQIAEDSSVNNAQKNIKRIEALNLLAEYIPPQDRIAFCQVVFLFLNRYINSHNLPWKERILFNRQVQCLYEKYVDILNESLNYQHVQNNNSLNLKYKFFLQHFKKNNELNYCFSFKYFLPLVAKNISKNDQFYHKKNIIFLKKYFTKKNYYYNNNFNTSFKAFCNEQSRNVFQQAINSNIPCYVIWGLDKLINSNKNHTLSFEYSPNDINFIINNALNNVKNYEEKFALKKSLENMARQTFGEYRKIISKAYFKHFGTILKFNDEKNTINKNFKKDKISSFIVKKNITMLDDFHANFIRPVTLKDGIFYLIEHERIPKKEIKNHKFKLISTKNQQLNYLTRLIKINPATGKITYGQAFLTPKNLFFSNIKTKHYTFFKDNNLIVLSRYGMIYYSLNLDGIKLVKNYDIHNFYSYKAVKKDDKLYIFGFYPAPQKLIMFDFKKRIFNLVYNQNSSNKYPLKGYKPHLALRGFDNNKENILFENMNIRKFIEFNLKTKKINKISDVEYQNKTLFDVNLFYIDRDTSSHNNYFKCFYRSFNPEIFDNNWDFKKAYHYLNSKKENYEYNIVSRTDKQYVFGLYGKKENEGSIKYSIPFIATKKNLDRDKVFTKEMELISSIFD